MVKYDVIFVDFPHRQHDGTSSKHPAVVLEGNRLARLAAQITGNLDVINDTDYELQDWKEAGLDKPCKVRLGQQEAFTEDAIISYFGHLTRKDINEIEKILKKNESLNESVTSNLQDKIIDCLDWFILMEMEFPKDKFLADSWEDVKDGIQMGIDPEFEVAEGIIEYLKPIITFNKKYNKEVGEEGVFQDEIEMYQSLVRAMNNYLAKNGYEDRIEEDFSFEDNVDQMKNLMGQNSNLFNKMIDDVETPKKDNRMFRFLKRKEK